MISPILEGRVSDYLIKKPLAELMEGFTKDMIVKTKRYRQEADQYRYVIGRDLLRRGIVDFGLSEEDVLLQIHYNEHGKPLLPNVWFSITHSGDWVFCVISSEGPIGIDVEVVREMDQPEHLREWFTNEEWDWIQQADDPLRTLYYLWTKKEALLKAVGCGLSGLGKIRYLDDNQMQLDGEKRIWTVKELAFSETLNIVGHVCY